MNEQSQFIREETYIAWDYYEQHRKDLRHAYIGWAGFSLKSVLLLNGASALALLALIGHLTTGDINQTQPIISAIVPALQWFLMGVGFAAVAGGAAYFGDGFSFATTIGPFEMVSLLRDQEMPSLKLKRKKAGNIFLMLAVIF